LFLTHILFVKFKNKMSNFSFFDHYINECNKRKNEKVIAIYDDNPNDDNFNYYDFYLNNKEQLNEKNR